LTENTAITISLPVVAETATVSDDNADWLRTTRDKRRTAAVERSYCSAFQHDLELITLAFL